jgi:hypothetical protein
LLDLVIDVPAEMSDVQRRVRRQMRSADDQAAGLLSYILRRRRRPLRRDDEEDVIGAATLLLLPEVQQGVPRLVIEGAPGQGKSTITQYVCQVHRMKLLGDLASFDRVVAAHRAAPVRFPFRIDLRDLDSWLARKDPFTADAPTPEQWQKSLESFLAAQVRFFSGGSEFSVSDLQAVAAEADVLLVFDGLDEVAELSRRVEVIREISRGVARMKECARSVQAVVTSRPAAFANSPALPPEEFIYVELGALTRPLIEQYAAKWMDAQKVVGQQRREINLLLKAKLEQSHIRELGRNPMQLTILLRSCIHTWSVFTGPTNSSL